MTFVLLFNISAERASKQGDDEKEERIMKSSETNRTKEQRGELI